MKLFILASLAVAASCAHFEYFDQQHRRQHDQHSLQVQNEMVREQNEKIRQHYQEDNFQRNEQMRQLEEQRRVQDQINRGQFYGHYNNYQNYYPSSYGSYKNRNFDNRNNFDNSNYNFDYAVADRQTGDVKSHHESRYGDNVEGRYTMVDSDGMQRVVEYRDNGEGLETKVMRVPNAFQGENFNNYQNFNVRPFQPLRNFQPTVFSSTQVHQEADNARSDYATTMTSNF
jgi:hypothetical protein